MLMLAVVFLTGAVVVAALSFTPAGPLSLPMVGFFLLLLAADVALLFAPPTLRSHRQLR